MVGGCIIGIDSVPARGSAIAGAGAATGAEIFNDLRLSSAITMIYTSPRMPSSGRCVV